MKTITLTNEQYEALQQILDIASDHDILLDMLNEADTDEGVEVLTETLDDLFAAVNSAGGE